MSFAVRRDPTPSLRAVPGSTICTAKHFPFLSPFSPWPYSSIRDDSLKFQVVER